MCLISRATGGGYHLAALVGGALKPPAIPAADPVPLPAALKGLVSGLLLLDDAYAYTRACT